MPASAGVSVCSAVRPILPSPSARSVPSCRVLWPTPERICVTLSLLIRSLVALVRRLRRLTSLRCRVSGSGDGDWLRVSGGGDRDGQDVADRQPAVAGDILRPA